MINVFQLTDQFKLVDLPGYGFAKVPETVRHLWGRTLERYLVGRKALLGLMLLMDARHPLTALDVQMLRWCSARRLPVHALLTKCDKLTRGKAASALEMVGQRAAAEFELTTVQLFSALDGRGIEEARFVLDAWFARGSGPALSVDS